MAYIQVCSFDLFASNKCDPKVFWIMMMIHAVLCFWSPVSIFMFFICTSPHTCVYVCVSAVCVWVGACWTHAWTLYPGLSPTATALHALISKWVGYGKGWGEQRGVGCDLGSEVWNWDWTVVETRPRGKGAEIRGINECDKWDSVWVESRSRRVLVAGS